MEVIEGNRIGKLGAPAVICCAVIFDPTGSKVLITRRTDNGCWCLPGGRMEPGESAEEACIREVKEETGLDVRVDKLIGIYTSPNRLLKYADGNRFQEVVLSFGVVPTGGTLD